MATATAPKPRTHAARLLLVIDATYYRVEILARGRAYRLVKMGSDGLAYDVVAQADHVSCTCGDYTYRRAGITPESCKHGAALVGYGLLG